MANGNVRVRERFELALDGGQIAAIVVGALVTVSAVFVLGLKMGQHLAARQALASRPADLTELDRPVVTGATTPPAPVPALQYADKLPRQKPAPPPPIEPPAPAAKPAAQAAAAPAPVPPPQVAAAVSDRPAERAAPQGEVVLPAPPAPTPAAAAAATGKAFTVQVASATTREDAGKVVARVKAHGPRVVEADVPGKGHFFRVRVGRFETREQAERFREDLARETGLKGLVMPE